jgi:SpoVK/Ycf46/Vps4 family AAA+-type ATPase
VTCPDDGWRASNGDSTGGGSSVFDALVGGRYRVEPLTAATRLAAFRRAFERHHIRLDKEAEDQLPLLCASALWAHGTSFERVARKFRALLVKQGNQELTASVGAFELALRTVRGGNAIASAQVRFQGTSGVEQPASALVKRQGIQGGDKFLGAVGGNSEAKLSLEDALALDPTRRQILAKFGLSPPTGILLYGPPGVGKTLLAKAVAQLLNTEGRNRTSGRPSSLGGAFVSLRSSDIVRAEIGTSEKMVVSAFELARKNAPSVIFIDEFQALFTERSSGGSGRLASTLLQCMDDIKRWRDLDNSVSTGGRGSEELQDQVCDSGNHVVVMGATNTPWLVDAAFVRPGRFDRVVFVGLPTVLERQSILLVHIRRMRMSSMLDANSVDVLCQIMADRTEGFSGADLAALCRAAAIRCLNDCGEEGDIEQGHFELALQYDVKPSSSLELVLRLQEWRPR